MATKDFIKGGARGYEPIYNESLLTIAKDTFDMLLATSDQALRCLLQARKDSAISFYFQSGLCCIGNELLFFY
jgi:hypothetical protein